MVKNTVLKRHFHLLQTNERLKKAFAEPPMVAFRRLKNLKDMLVHSSQNRLEREDDEVRQCGNLWCKCCPHMQENNKFNTCNLFIVTKSKQQKKSTI